MRRKRLSLLVALLLCLGVIAWSFVRPADNIPTPTARPTHATTNPSTPVASSIMPEPTTSSVAVAPPSNAQTVLELFNPSDQALTRQLNETNLSQQIEEVITSSFIFYRCGLITDAQYADIYNAAITYAHASNLASSRIEAEATVRRLTISASTSYRLVYRRLSCNAPQLTALAEQLIAWSQRTAVSSSNR